MSGKEPIPYSVVLMKLFCSLWGGSMETAQSEKYLLISMRAQVPSLELPWTKPWVIVHASNSSTGEVEMGGSGGGGLTGQPV